MPLWKIAWRSIQQRGLASFFTGLSMALGVSLVVAILVASGVVGKSFQSSAGLGYNMIVGAKGGSLQLVLNTVYHLSRPVENIPYWYYKEFLPAAQRGDGRDGKFAQYSELAIPCCMGDYFRGYRVVGTNTHLFDDMEYSPGQKYQFAEGRNFRQHEFFKAVVGAGVARDTGLKLGDQFHPTHGEAGHEHDAFEVVGILKPTGTPNDRAVFVNMEGFYLMEGHARPVAQEGSPGAGAKSDVAQREAEHAHEDEHDHAGEAGHPRPLPEDQREVTAILLRTKSAVPGAPPELFAPHLVKMINKENVAQAVLPVGEISRLFDTLVGPLTTLLLALAVLIVIVSGIGIMVSIYNSMAERRHEIAIMRALGAGRQTVMLIVLLESILLALGGGACGWLLGHLLMGFLGPWIAGVTSVHTGFLQFAPRYELILIPGLIVLAALVGYLPALSAYRTDVARSLSATP